MNESKPSRTSNTIDKTCKNFPPKTLKMIKIFVISLKYKTIENTWKILATRTNTYAFDNSLITNMNKGVKYEIEFIKQFITVKIQNKGPLSFFIGLNLFASMRIEVKTYMNGIQIKIEMIKRAKITLLLHVGYTDRPHLDLITPAKRSL